MGTNFNNHRGRKPKVYNLWCSIKTKCYCKTSKPYQYYGARGITMQQSWIKDYDKFYKYVSSLDKFDLIDDPKLKLSLDRIDNNKGYEENNLRWADVRTQRLNTRRNKNNKTGFVGVYSAGKAYSCSIFINKKTIYLGSRKDPLSAYKLRYNYIINNNLKHYEAEIARNRHHFTKS